MTNQEKWNKIVDLHEQYMYSREEIIQNIWEHIFFEFFGYSKLSGEIDVQRSIQIGSTERVVTDIIIKNKSKDLFIVEIKQQTSKKGKDQLLSYLKLLNVNFGVLINEKINIIDYDYKKRDFEQKMYEINFNRNSRDGELFVEMFSKPFNYERAQEFIAQRTSTNQHIEEIIEMIDEKYVKDLLLTDLSNIYDQTEIEEALDKTKILISRNLFNKSIRENEKPGETDIDKPGPLEVKIGQAVQDFFNLASINNSLSEELINQLCQKSYSKSKFNLNREVLIEVANYGEVDIKRKDKHGHGRYYTKPYRFNGKLYILCSQWTTAQEPHFYEWKRFFESNVIVR